MKTYEEIKSTIESFSPYNSAGELVNTPGSLKALGQFWFGSEANFVEVSKDLQGKPLIMGNEIIIPGQYSGDSSEVQFTLRIMAKVDSKDLQEVKAEDLATLNLMQQVLAKLKTLQINNELKQGSTAPTIEPVETTYGTSFIGWQVNLSFLIDFVCCINETEWN